MRQKRKDQKKKPKKFLYRGGTPPYPPLPLGSIFCSPLKKKKKKRKKKESRNPTFFTPPQKVKESLPTTKFYTLEKEPKTTTPKS